MECVPVKADSKNETRAGLRRRRRGAYPTPRRRRRSDTTKPTQIGSLQEIANTPDSTETEPKDTLGCIQKLRLNPTQLT
jgi:hypothetical protein